MQEHVLHLAAVLAAPLARKAAKDESEETEPQSGRHWDVYTNTYIQRKEEEVRSFRRGRRWRRSTEMPGGTELTHKEF